MKFSLLVFIVLFSCVLILSGSIMYVQTAGQLIDKKMGNIENRTTVMDVVTEIVMLLETDPTPYADSRTDPVWDYIRLEEYPEEVAYVELKDISSKLNINSVRSDFLSHVGVFNETETSPKEFEAYRYKLGLTLDHIDMYQQYFDFDVLDTLISSYGPMNINHADEIMLEMLFLERTDDQLSAMIFRDELREKRKEMDWIALDDFYTMSGQHYPLVQSVITTEPVININFASKEVIESVFQYPFDKLVNKDVDTILERIIALRENLEIDEYQLQSIIGIEDEKNRLYSYLGAKTWVWEVIVSIHERQYITRIMLEAADNSYKVIEQIW